MWALSVRPLRVQRGGDLHKRYGPFGFSYSTTELTSWGRNAATFGPLNNGPTTGSYASRALQLT
jgi:hypothetical protein